MDPRELGVESDSLSMLHRMLGEIAAIADRKGNEQELEITCQAHLWNWAKAVMCKKFYKDMDTSCCHPVLLVQICKQHDLP